MNSVAEFLKRSADRNGFTRDRFDERKLPSDFTNVCILPFFGDYRTLMVSSAFLMHRFRSEIKGSKYFIIASWPGMQGLFPYVDEYWSFNDQAHIVSFYEEAVNFNNKSDLSTIYKRNLNEFFRDVISVDEFQNVYNHGFTNYFFDRFIDTKRFVPFVPSSAILGKDFNRDLTTKAGYKILIHPSVFYKQWNQGRPKNVRVNKDFWIELCKFLLANNCYPVVWQNSLSYDISPELEGQCLFLKENDIIRVLAAMRATGYVLDVFNNISRFALLARCPFLAVDERSRYQNLKEYEIDDLCSPVYSNYIFTFSTLLNGNVRSWNQDLFPSILKRLDKSIPTLDRDGWPTTAESMDVVKYKQFVRKITPKKLGAHFIKVPKY